MLIIFSFIFLSELEYVFKCFGLLLIFLSYLLFYNFVVISRHTKVREQNIALTIKTVKQDIALYVLVHDKVDHIVSSLFDNCVVKCCFDVCNSHVLMFLLDERHILYFETVIVISLLLKNGSW